MAAVTSSGKCLVGLSLKGLSRLNAELLEEALDIILRYKTLINGGNEVIKSLKVTSHSLELNFLKPGVERLEIFCITEVLKFILTKLALVLSKPASKICCLLVDSFSNLLDYLGLLRDTLGIVRRLVRLTRRLDPKVLEVLAHSHVLTGSVLDEHAIQVFHLGNHLPRHTVDGTCTKKVSSVGKRNTANVLTSCIVELNVALGKFSVRYLLDKLTDLGINCLIEVSCLLGCSSDSLSPLLDTHASYYVFIIADQTELKCPTLTKCLVMKHSLLSRDDYVLLYLPASSHSLRRERRVDLDVLILKDRNFRLVHTCKTLTKIGLRKLYRIKLIDHPIYSACKSSTTVRGRRADVVLTVQELFNSGGLTPTDSPNVPSAFERLNFSRPTNSLLTFCLLYPSLSIRRLIGASLKSISRVLKATSFLSTIELLTTISSAKQKIVDVVCRLSTTGGHGAIPHRQSPWIISSSYRLYTFGLSRWNFNCRRRPHAPCGRMLYSICECRSCFITTSNSLNASLGTLKNSTERDGIDGVKSYICTECPSRLAETILLTFSKYLSDHRLTRVTHSINESLSTLSTAYVVLRRLCITPFVINVLKAGSLLLTTKEVISLSLIVIESLAHCSCLTPVKCRQGIECALDYRTSCKPIPPALTRAVRVTVSCIISAISIDDGLSQVTYSNPANGAVTIKASRDSRKIVRGIHDAEANSRSLLKVRNLPVVGGHSK